MSTTLTIIITLIITIITSSLVAAVLTITWDMRRRRSDVTKEFIDEFLSSNFLRHRIGIAKLRRKLLNQDVQISEVARGFWYPGGKGVYEGEVSQQDGFNEHQHLEAYLGFLVRLRHAVKIKQVNKPDIKSALETSYVWHADLTNALAAEIRRQVAADPRAILPITVEAIELINDIMGCRPIDLMSRSETTLAAPPVAGAAAGAAPTV